jgi:ABC-type sugar transport system substrate-binding protein
MSDWTTAPRDELLRQYPDLAGIYNIGGAADGVARALMEMKRARDVVFIDHGLTSDTREACCRLLGLRLQGRVLIVRCLV